MQYECVHCDERFEADDAPRCPKCLRKHGLRRLKSDDSPATGGGGRMRNAAIGAALFAVVAGIAYVTLGSPLTAASPLAALTTSDLDQHLKAAGVGGTDIAKPYEPTAAMRDYAKALPSAPLSAAQRLVDTLTERASKQAFLQWSRADVREGGMPENASATLDKVQKAGGRAQLYPLEVAVLAVSLLRARDIDAQLVEVFAYPGERAPLDPSGRLGYYAIGVRKSEGSPRTLFDPYGARKTSPSAEDYELLDDAQTVGAAHALRAMHKLVNENDYVGALADADIAVKLSPSSPTVRSVRAAVLLASGGTTEGERELEAAAQLRPDAPRRNNLAMIALAKGDVERAAKEVAQALAATPDYAAGHLTLASVHMARGERDLARAELESAERIDPTLPTLQIAWAEFHAASGDLARAIERGESAVRARPRSMETHLVLARIYRQASRFDEMRMKARKVLELAPADSRERTRALLLNVLGPTALEEPSVPTPSSAASASSSPDLKLGTSTPSGLQLGADEPKLKLGAGNGKLKLDLGD